MKSDIARLDPIIPMIHIIQYAGNIGVEVVIGSDHKLKITSSEKINLPGKGTRGKNL